MELGMLPIDYRYVDMGDKEKHTEYVRKNPHLYYR